MASQSLLAPALDLHLALSGQKRRDEEQEQEQEQEQEGGVSSAVHPRRASRPRSRRDAQETAGGGFRGSIQAPSKPRRKHLSLRAASPSLGAQPLPKSPTKSSPSSLQFSFIGSKTTANHRLQAPTLRHPLSAPSASAFHSFRHAQGSNSGDWMAAEAKRKWNWLVTCWLPSPSLLRRAPPTHFQPECHGVFTQFPGSCSYSRCVS